jgi:hypothetical protein
MRNADDDLDAAIKGTFQRLNDTLSTEITILRKGDQLQIDIGLYPFADVEQGIDRQQTRIADIDLAANSEQPLGDSEVTIAQGAPNDRLMRQRRLQLAQSAIPSSSAPERLTRGMPR